MNPSTGQNNLGAFFANAPTAQATTGAFANVMAGGFGAKHQLDFSHKDSNIGECWRVRIISMLPSPMPFCRIHQTREATLTKKDGGRYQTPVIMPAPGTPAYAEAMQLRDHAGTPLEARVAKDVTRLLVFVYDKGSVVEGGAIHWHTPINAWKWIDFKPSLASSAKAMQGDGNTVWRDEMTITQDATGQNIEKHWLGATPGTDPSPLYDVVIKIVQPKNAQYKKTYELAGLITTAQVDPNTRLPVQVKHPNAHIWHQSLMATEPAVLPIGNIWDLTQPTWPPALTQLGAEIVAEMEEFEVGLASLRQRFGYKEGQFGPEQGLHYGGDDAQQQQAPQQGGAMFTPAPANYMAQPVQASPYMPQQAPVQQAPQQFVQQAPAQQAPQQVVQQAPVQQQYAQAPVQQAPQQFVQQAPVEAQQYAQAPVQQVPVQQVPVQQAPQQMAPVQQQMAPVPAPEPQGMNFDQTTEAIPEPPAPTHVPRFGRAERNA